MGASGRGDERDVRAEVIVAATRLMAARGFEGTSLQDIADAVGVSKPAVLHHFASKELIHAEVMNTIFEHWQQTLPRLMMAATSGEGRFEAIFSELQRFFREDPNRARLLVRQGLDRPKELRETLKGTVRPWLGVIANYIRMGEESHPRDLDAEAYAMIALQLVIFTSAMGDTVSVAIDDTEEARARYYQEVMRIARQSLFVEPPGARAKRR